jgi:glycine hydroxymethyltransferase
MDIKIIRKFDSQIAKLIEAEKKRREEGLEMIPSENHTSQAVLEPLASILNDKYAEGFPGKRYYGGNEIIDKVEILCQERLKKLFKVPFANVQPYSGSPANQAVYFAVLNPDDTVMGMNLPSGGHLTHGWKNNFSGLCYKSISYDINEKTGLIDYAGLAKLAKENKPKLIWAGATAYPRFFDWK